MNETKTITQKIVFKGTKSKDLYGIYMNSKKHAAATGAPAEISKKVGERWKAYKGEIRGTNLMVKANKLIVQTWRVKSWKSDSILTLSFRDTRGGCELTMVHALVPEKAAPHIKKGWGKMYWSPMKKYLRSQA